MSGPESTPAPEEASSFESYQKRRDDMDRFHEAIRGIRQGLESGEVTPEEAEIMTQCLIDLDGKPPQ